MADIQPISDRYSSGGQPTADMLKQLADEGYRSVLNLRSPTESGVLDDEQQHAEVAGLHYATVPLNSTEANAELSAEALSVLAELPTPVYIHCGAGGRASALALIASATQQQWSRDEILAKAQELGINPDQPHLKQFLESR